MLPLPPCPGSLLTGHRISSLSTVAPKTSCFVLVFSYADRQSFDNISLKWKGESRLNTTNNDPPIILIGNKSDREDEDGMYDRL